MVARVFCVTICFLALASTGAAGVLDHTPLAPMATAPAHGDEHLYVGDSVVRIEAGHVPAVQGKMVLNIDDLVSTQVGGLVCQAPPGLAPCPPVHPFVSDDSWIFCNGITMDVTRGWDPTMDLWIYVGAPFDTWALGFGVHCEDPRPGTVGWIRHFPPA